MSQIAFKYLRYFLTSSNGKGHGVHSPFVFNFIKNVLNDRRNFYAYDKIEKLRTTLLMDHTEVKVVDLGAGSSLGDGARRTVASICRNTSKSPKYGQLLFRISQYFQPAVMVELGTSLGISSSYLASGNPGGRLITCEGSDAVAGLAERNFSALKMENIQMVRGNFDDTLPGILQENPQIDLAFIDGNHRKDPTLSYFYSLLPCVSEYSVIIFDDIHWSPGMEEAWNTIKDHPAVTLSIDLFFVGLVFFRKEFLEKQHFVIRF